MIVLQIRDDDKHRNNTIYLMLLLHEIVGFSRVDGWEEKDKEAMCMLYLRSGKQLLGWVSREDYSRVITYFNSFDIISKYGHEGVL